MTGARPISIGGRRAVLEAIRSGRAIEVVVASGARRTAAYRDVLDAAGTGGVTVREADREELDRLAPDHHGAVARVRLPDEIDERGLTAWPFDDEAFVVVLDGVDDPQNLGAAARSADGAGAAMLVTRVHRAAPVTPAAVRASAGALLHVPHARVANIARALRRLQGSGFTVVGLDERAEASIYDQPGPSGRMAIVVGSEGHGMARLTREACDLVVRLPMCGGVGSLNASASLAAVLYAYVLPSRSLGAAPR